MSSYIGRGIDQIDNISTLDNLSFNGSDTTFNLTQNSVAFNIISVDALQIQIDGIIQIGNFTQTGASQIQFNFTPNANSVCNGIKHFGVGLLTTVSDGAITNVKLGADSVNGSKIADDSISDEHLDITAITGQTAITSLADTDKFLVSDASDSGNLKYVENQYLGGGSLNFITEASSSSNHSEVVFNNCFSSTYENYLIIGDISVTNNGDTIRARLKDASGQLQASEYVYRFQRYDSNSNTSTGNTRATGDSYFQLTEGVNNDHERVSYTFKMYIFDPLSTSKRMGLRQESIVVNNSAVMSSVEGAGQYKNGTAITGILFYPSGNNFSNSTIRIYGISNS